MSAAPRSSFSRRSLRCSRWRRLPRPLTSFAQAQQAKNINPRSGRRRLPLMTSMMRYGQFMPRLRLDDRWDACGQVSGGRHGRAARRHTGSRSVTTMYSTSSASISGLPCEGCGEDDRRSVRASRSRNTHRTQRPCRAAPLRDRRWCLPRDYLPIRSIARPRDLVWVGTCSGPTKYDSDSATVGMHPQTPEVRGRCHKSAYGAAPRRFTPLILANPPAGQRRSRLTARPGGGYPLILVGTCTEIKGEHMRRPMLRDDMRVSNRLAFGRSPGPARGAGSVVRVLSHSR